MNAKYLFSGILAAGMLFTACNDELDIEKKGNLGDPETYYTSDDAAMAAISMNYALINRMMPYHLYDLLDNLSDDMYTGGGSSTDYNDHQLINAYAFGSDNPDIKTSYQFLYTLIYDSNLILTYVTKNETITPVMKQVISEAYFFRGLAHMYLGAMWGNAPIVTELMQPSECQVANAESREAVYNQAMKDFEDAINYGGLPSKSGKGDIQKRITKELAQAYLGKTAVFAGNWGKATAALGAVIGSDLYDLEPVSNYENLLNNRSEGSPEILWCRYITDSSLPQSDWNAPQGANNYFEDHVMRGWRNDGFAWGSVYGQGGAMGDMEPGYGECNPRANLYNSMKEWELANGAKNTPRLNATMKDYAWMQENGLSMNETYKQFGNEGYWFWKNRFLTEEIIGYYGMGGWNVWISSQFRFMRYSEVLLLAAEAYLQAGNSVEATKCLNKVRKRAEETEVGTATMDMIKNEKRFELCIEGCRWIDIVRWGDAASLLANQGKQVPEFNGKTVNPAAVTHPNGGFVTGKHELLPYPATELLVNPNIAQNPGWAAVLSE